MKKSLDEYSIETELITKRGREKPKLAKDVNKLAMHFKETKSERDFRTLVNTIHLWLRTFIFNYLKDPESTQDVLSKTIYDIYYNIDKFDCNIAKFSTWSYTIAKHNALNYLEYESRHGFMNSFSFDEMYDSTKFEDDVVSSAIADIDLYEHEDESSDIVVEDGNYVSYSREKIMADMYDASVECIKELPVEYRVIVECQLLYNKKVEDIAIDNGVPVSSIKNWLREGKFMLSEMIKNRYSKLYKMYEELAS